mgnify:CR=1 FL=1
MSIDNNTLIFFNLKETQVEDISTISNNNNFLNAVLKKLIKNVHHVIS